MPFTISRRRADSLTTGFGAVKYLSPREVFLNSRSMDNLFLNRVITPVEDAAGGEADKTRGKGS